MKENVFIAWSGSSILAEEVATILSEKKYTAVVGGNRTVNPDSFFVGQTIINQMAKCSRAIFIITKKQNLKTGQGDISNNLFFELGYMIASLKNTKIHMFYVDIDKNDPLIPSDLCGIWAEHLISTDKSNISLAREIVEIFMCSHHETITEDKMDIILRWYEYKNLLKNHLETPKYSDFEMAQYILFYIQAVFFFDDYHESLYILENIKENSINFSYELRCSVNCAILILRFYQKITTKNIDSSYFDQLISDFEYSVDNSKDMCDSEFKKWYEIIHYENIGFAYYLLLLNNDLSIQEIDELIPDMLNICAKTLNMCENLLNNGSGNASKNTTNLSANFYFIALYKAYIYRQIAIAYQIAEKNNTNIPTEFNQLCADATNRSFEMRRILYEKFDAPYMNQLLKNNFEMEYFIAMAETIQHKVDINPREFERRKRMLKTYIKKVHEQNHLNKDIITKITSAIGEDD